MLSALATLLVAGYLLPERLIIPVEGATTRDWNEQTFWYEPWGVSGVHKGIDIFAPAGQPVIAATGGVVVFSGTLGIGGNVVVVLGPKWRFHYYAHLKRRDVSFGRFVGRGARLGTVGNSGNAAGTPSHLHYSIATLIPYPWRITTETQGYLKMFFLDPDAKLRR
ncbi:MAG: M23 family metallopeptidase [Woeseiaceae bacterium]|nr:M23 family metallopeptidase [Woeseiaceae bacterium]